MKEHGQAWASKPAPSVCGGEGGSWDNHFLSGQSGCLSVAPAHGSMGSSMPSCFAPVSALGFPSQKGDEGEGRGIERKTGGGEEGKEKEDEEFRRRGEREKMWPEPWVLAKSPSFSSAPSPTATQPLPGCLSLHNGRFSAEISRYWIPGLEFCPPTMSRQRSMLQGRHTLQAKSWKTIPPFISIRKGEKSPPNLFFFSIAPFPPHLFPVSKPEEGCQARSSSTRPLWLIELLRGREKNQWNIVG